MTSIAWCGQPVERFRSADHFTFSQGSAEARYGNSDATVKVTMQVTFLGQQVLTNPSTAAETRFNKVFGSLDFEIKLSDFDPNLPPDTVTMTGSDLGGDLLKHTADQVLPGPYVVQGTFSGTPVNLTLSNVHVTGALFSQGSGSVTLPWVNPVLNELCDVQFDDVNGGSQNTLTAVPAQVSGWVVSPLFSVQSMRVDVTGIQQAGQTPAQVVAPDTFLPNLGRTDVGNVGSLAGADSNVLRICRYFVPNVLVPPVNYQVTATLSQAPQYISMFSVSRMDSAGSFKETLEMFDYSVGTYLPADSRADVVTNSFNTRKLDVTGSASRFVGPGNVVKARRKVEATGFVAKYAWCHEQDQLVWLTTP